MSIIGEKIGSEPTLPYLSPELDGEKLLNGANFASAGIGILNDTGVQFVSLTIIILDAFVCNFTMQLQPRPQFKTLHLSNCV